MKFFEQLTDLQWQLVESFFPVPEKRTRGKPHTPWRHVLNSILFVLITGTKWESLPKLPEFASKSAAHRWYKVWKANGVLDQVLAKLKELSGLAGELTYPSTRNRVIVLAS